MGRIPIVIVVLLLLLVSSAPALGQTPGPATPEASGSVDLSDVDPLPMTEERQAAFEAYIGEMLTKTQVPGAAVAVVQNGEVVYQQGFGVRQKGGSDPVTPETLMMIGSITKPMTATMAATVVDDGELTWETPVVELLPEFAVADPALTERLSIRNAFCACTGLPQRDPEFLFTSATLTPERLITSVKDFPLTAPLGEQFQYSNQLFAIGGYAAAAAATPEETDLFDAYDTAMRQRLLDPLGMSGSTFALDEVQASGNWAQPHGVTLIGEYHPVPVEDDQRHVLSVAPAGALWSSATEMARFVQMELGGGVAPDGTQVVSQANLDATWQTQVTVEAPPFPEGSGVPQEFASMVQGYGLGWVTGDYRGQPLYWHSGGTFGFSAQTALLPDAGLGVVILTNGINAQFFTLAVQYRLFELAFDQPPSFDPFVAGGIAAEAQQAADRQGQLGVVDPAAIAPYVGRYGHDVLGEVDIVLGDGTLTLDAGEFRGELRPLQDPDTGETVYLTSDLPVAGVATVTFSEESGAPVMTFTDPTTGEAYHFTFVGAAGARATPSP